MAHRSSFHDGQAKFGTYLYLEKTPEAVLRTDPFCHVFYKKFCLAQRNFSFSFLEIIMPNPGLLDPLEAADILAKAGFELTIQRLVSFIRYWAFRR